MDPLTWEDLVPKNPVPPPEDEDFSQYFSDYKAYDNLFNEALSTLQDLDVPSGYAQVEAPPHAREGRENWPSREYSGQGRENYGRENWQREHPSRGSYSRTGTPFRHQKKPSGTAIFGFIDHNRELSLNGSFPEDEFRLRPPADSIKSISPTQLARHTRPAVSQDQLELNFDQPFEAVKPILLDEAEERDESRPVQGEDIIVTKTHPKSYKFPPEPELEFSSGYLPDDKGRAKRYVPIPVQQPVMGEKLGPPAQISRSERTLEGSSLKNDEISNEPIESERLLSSERLSPQRHSLGRSPERHSPERSPERLSGPELRPERYNRDFMTNVFLPPPSSESSGYESPEPHSPQYPQQKRSFYNPQFFSDDVNGYYSDPQGPQLNSSPIRSSHGSPQSSPIRHLKRDVTADDTIVDANETILQLTPLKGQAPMTPSKSKITLEWSPIISPNEKASLDVRKAIQDLSPRRVVKKTSLLPQGELDRYWEGPDEDKEFTCTYKNCGKKFTRRYNVRSHIQTHLCDRPFVCTYCPKSFVRQHDLNRHIKTHLAAKHCRCKCGKEFTRVEGYRKHLANGRCHGDGVKVRDGDAVSKPGAHRRDNILDGLTSNRLNEDLFEN